MPEFNANWIVLFFGFVTGIEQYGRSLRKGTTRGEAATRAVWMTFYLLAVSFVWLLILDAWRLSWISLYGFGIGVGVMLVATLALLAFQSWWQRPRHWR